MRLSTQFKIILAVFSIVLIVIGASILVNSEQINQSRSQENIANRIVQGAGELTYLTNDYVVYREIQQLSRWQERYAILSSDIGNLTATSSNQRALIQEIKASQQNMKTVFDSIVASIGTLQDSNALTQVLQSSWSRIAIQSQTLITDSTQLAQLLRSQVDQLNLINFLLIFVALAIFSGFIGVIYFQTFRRTLKSISNLQAGTRVIGAGNLDYRLKESSKDEIGDLSHAFNQMAADLKNTTSQLQTSERMVAIGATAGMVGHDIRNPLHAIKGDVYLTRVEVEGLPEGQSKTEMLENLQAIDQNIDYINKIVADLQDYARQTAPQVEELDLEALVEKALSTIKIPENILANFYVEPSAKIKADPTYIRRIITNLTTNAIQAMPNGGKLTIEATRQDKGKTMQITVVDTGGGIPKEVQAKVFQPLFTTKSKGQGFGLAVVKKFVEELGGTIRFESEEGKGTKFTVSLPDQKR